MSAGPDHDSELRLLIVDDSLAVGEMLTDACATLPRLKVVGQALDGFDALEALRRLKPDAVTLDIRMPNMNGIEVLKAIKEEGLACRIIMFTGVGEEVYREKCLGLGADYFFDKATEFEKLIEVLKEVTCS